MKRRAALPIGLALALALTAVGTRDELAAVQEPPVGGTETRGGRSSDTDPPSDVWRSADTRDLLAARTQRCVAIPGAEPGDVAVINITNTGALGDGWGALRASDAAAVYDRDVVDQYASVNFAAATPPNPNLGFSKIGPDERVCYDGAVSGHEVILDLMAVIPSERIDAIDPVRVVDTRGGDLVAASSSRCFTVAAGASPGDVAVINITNTHAAGDGWGALRASDATPVFSRPVAGQYASVNFAAGTPPNPNLAFTRLGPDNRFCYDAAVHAHHLILDLVAFIPAADIVAVAPRRLVDTRGAAPVSPDSSRCFVLADAQPGDIAVVNITNTGAAGTGWGALRASDRVPVYSRPVVDQYASVNFAAGSPPNPNLAVTEIGPDQRFCYDGAVRAHHLILDLVASIPAGNIIPVDPIRLADTRSHAEPGPRTTVVSGADLDAMTVVDDAVTIPEGHPDDDVEVGDVLVAAPTVDTPDGLFRAVTAVETTPGGVVASTIDVDFGYALEDAHVSATVPIEPERMGDILTDDGGTVALDATTIIDREEGFVIVIDRVLEDRDGDESTTDDQITLTGTLAVDLHLQFDLDVTPLDFELDPLEPVRVGSVDHVRLALSGTVTSNLQLDAAYADQFGIDPEELIAVELGTYPLPVPSPVPIVVSPRLPLRIGYDGEVSAAIDTSATLSAHGTLGFEYDRGDWEPIEDFDAHYDVVPPMLSSGTHATARLFAELLFELPVNGFLGELSAGVRGTVRVEMFPEAPWACVYGQVTVPIEVDILTVDAYRTTLGLTDDALLYPAACDPGGVIGDLPDVEAVPGYSRTLGACTGDGYPMMERGLEALPTEDGGVIVAASTGTTFQSDESAFFPELWVVRLDAAGDVVWEHRYAAETPVALLDAPTGPIVVTDREFVFLRADGTVRDVWTWETGGAFMRGAVLAPGGDGYLAFGGNSVAWLSRIGSDGIVRWTREYTIDGGAWGGTIRGASPAPGGRWTVGVSDGYVMSVDDVDGTPLGARMMRVDGRNVFAFGRHAAAGPDGQLAYGVDHPAGSGRTIVARVDADLDLTAESVYEPAEFRSLAWLPDGDVAVAGLARHGVGDPVGLGLQRINDGGDIEWTVEYFAGDPFVAHRWFSRAIVPTTDGGLVTLGSTWSLAAERCGRVFDPADAGFQDIAWDLWVLKTPSTGLMSPRAGSGLTRQGMSVELPGLDVTAEDVTVTSAPDTYVIAIERFVDRQPTSATVASQAP